jgi:OPA family glycerol-3-phosphate transporter-like MFS transporter
MDGDRPGVAHVTVVYALLFLAMGVAYVPWMAGYSEDAEDVRPSLQGAALGLWGMVVRLMIVVLLVVAPQIVADGGWGRWMLVALGGQVVFLLSIAAYGGRWRRTRPDSAPRRDSAEAVG